MNMQEKLKPCDVIRDIKTEEDIPFSVDFDLEDIQQVEVAIEFFARCLKVIRDKEGERYKICKIKLLEMESIYEDLCNKDKS